MDDDLIQKVKQSLLARVSCPDANTYNIVIPISKEAADGLLNAFCDFLQKRDANGTLGEKGQNGS